MRILIHKDDILEKMGGSTISLMQILEVMVDLGHEAAAIASKADVKNIFNIPVFQEIQPSIIREFYSWADVVFIKQRVPLQHVKEYQRWHVPHKSNPIFTVFFASNVGQPYRYGYIESDVDLVVFNTNWVKRETGWQGESFVLHPPVFIEKYKVDKPGECITQINLAPQKGGALFWKIVSALPDCKFLAVIGKEKNQIIPDSLPPNVEISEYTNDIRNIYARTKILLMPSQGYGNQDILCRKSLWTESYGRVGVEASISGIPVLAYPTPGIKEALGDFGIYNDMNSEQWVSEIRRLSLPDQYLIASEKARTIRKRLSPLEDIKKLDKLLLSKMFEKIAFKKASQYKAYFDVPEQLRPRELPKRRKKIMNVDVVVLVTGEGLSWFSLKKNQPKTLFCDENGISVIEHILEVIINSSNWDPNFILVAGNCRSIIQEIATKTNIPAKIRCVFNPFQNQYGPLISFWLGLAHTNNDRVLFLNGDVLIKDALVKKINKWMYHETESVKPEIGLFVSKPIRNKMKDIKVFIDNNNNFMKAGNSIYLNTFTLTTNEIICVRDLRGKNALTETLEQMFKDKSAYKKNYQLFNLINLVKNRACIDLIQGKPDSWRKVDTLNN